MNEGKTSRLHDTQKIVNSSLSKLKRCTEWGFARTWTWSSFKEFFLLATHTTEQRTRLNLPIIKTALQVCWITGLERKIIPSSQRISQQNNRTIQQGQARVSVLGQTASSTPTAQQAASWMASFFCRRGSAVIIDHELHVSSKC